MTYSGKIPELLIDCLISFKYKTQCRVDSLPVPEVVGKHICLISVYLYCCLKNGSLDFFAFKPNLIAFATSIHEPPPIEIIESHFSTLKSSSPFNASSYLGFEVKFEKTWEDEKTGRKYYDPKYGYIDHDHELGEFLEAVFRDEDTLLSFIFDGLVYTGNDNSDSLACFPQQKFDEEFDRKEQKWVQVENEYYDQNSVNFDWYVKGN